MSRFQDLLNKPLPSQTSDVVTEGCCESDCNKQACEEDAMLAAEIDTTDVEDDSDEVGTSDVEDISNSDDDFDPDDMSDEDLAELDAELSGKAVDAVAGDDLGEEKLSPEEELRADDMMGVAATSLLVNDELNAEEKADFVSSEDAKIAVEEGFMTESDINELAEELGLATEGAYNKKMLIRLDAASKKKQLFALGVNVSAAAHKDPDYYKLKKVMKMRKILRARLTQKYKSEATKRMKVYFNRLKKSKAAPLSKIGNKVDR